MNLESQTLNNFFEGKPKTKLPPSNYKMKESDWEKIENELAEYKDLMKQL